MSAPRQWTIGSRYQWQVRYQRPGTRRWTNIHHQYIFQGTFLSASPTLFLVNDQKNQTDTKHITSSYLQKAKQIHNKQHLTNYFSIMSAVVVAPLSPPAGSKINFGAAISGVDVENLTGKI